MMSAHRCGEAMFQRSRDIPETWGSAEAVNADHVHRSQIRTRWSLMKVAEGLGFRSSIIRDNADDTDSEQRRPKCRCAIGYSW